MQISYKSFVFIYLIFNSLLNELDALNESCQTPSGSIGTCVEINDCPSFLNKLLDRGNNLTEKERKYVRDSSCSFDKSNVFICCPTIDVNDMRPIHFPETINSELLPQPPNCGYISNEYNGDAPIANLNEYPWIALIEYTKDDYEKTHYCAGTLINKRYVLTAAHCIVRAPLNWNLTGVRLGEWDTSTNPDCVRQTCAEPYSDYGIEKVVIHPEFKNSMDFANDIALLRLNKDVTFSNSIQPICLSTLQNQKSDYYVDRIIETTGWQNAQGLSSQKQKSNKIVWNFETCKERYNLYNFKLTTNQICSAGINDNDSCLRDSGGPLMLQETFGNHKSYVIVGVSSFGPTVCTSSWPSVYTKVGAYTDWITSVVQN